MRKWHRWISLPAILFLLVVSASGLVLHVKALLNDDEESAEKLEDVKSKVSLSSLATQFAMVDRTRQAVLAKYGDIKIKKVEVELRQTPSTVAFSTDEVQPKVIVVNSETSIILSERATDDDRFWIRLHSGEILGDLGRSAGIFSGLALLFLTLSGFWIYLKMYRTRNKTTSWWSRLFW